MDRADATSADVSDDEPRAVVKGPKPGEADQSTPRQPPDLEPVGASPTRLSWLRSTTFTGLVLPMLLLVVGLLAGVLITAWTASEARQDAADLQLAAQRSEAYESYLGSANRFISETGSVLAMEATYGPQGASGSDGLFDLRDEAGDAMTRVLIYGTPAIAEQVVVVQDQINDFLTALNDESISKQKAARGNLIDENAALLALVRDETS